MKFGLLDALECSCGRSQFVLANAVTKKLPLTEPLNEVPCKKFCGYKGCQINCGNVTLADCMECRALSVVGGLLRCDCGRTWPITDGLPEFSVRRLGQTPTDDLRVVELDFHSDPRWLSFIAAHPDGSIYHHPGWLQALAAENGAKCVTLACENAQGELLALLPLIRTRGAPLRIGGLLTDPRLSSLPRTPLAGPLSVNRVATAAVLQTAVDQTRKEPGAHLQLKTQNPGFEALVDGLVRKPWRLSYVLRLPEPNETLRAGNSRSRRHHVKWAVKKATELGVQVRPAEKEEELRSWYELYLHTMRRNGFPPRPYRLFATMWKQLHPRGMMQLLLAEQHQMGSKRLLAGSVLLMFGQTVSYAFTGCRQKDFSLHPQDLIQWTSLNDASKAGFRWYDFGEVPEDHPGLINYKSKWGAEPKPLYHYYYPAPPEGNVVPSSMWVYAKGLEGAIWRRLPLALTAWLGDKFYSYL
jgi:hypothetical protein